MCPVCLEKIVIIRSPFCPGCRRLTAAGQYCRTCRNKPDINLTGVIIAAYFHEGPIREAIHQFKYESVRGLSEDLGSILIKRLEAGFPAGDLVLVPVPLHSSREAWRGYNQARELAKFLSETYDIPMNDSVLLRKKNTKPQIELSRPERVKNIAGAFALKPKFNVEKLQKKTILLVDDVMTSGFTLNECAKVLRSVGCKRIWGLVLARG